MRSRRIRCSNWQLSIVNCQLSIRPCGAERHVGRSLRDCHRRRCRLRNDREYVTYTIIFNFQFSIVNSAFCIQHSALCIVHCALCIIHCIFGRCRNRYGWRCRPPYRILDTSLPGGALAHPSAVGAALTGWGAGGKQSLLRYRFPGMLSSKRTSENSCWQVHEKVLL